MQAQTLPSRPPFEFLAGEVQIFRPRPVVSTFDWARNNLRIVTGPYKGRLWQPDVLPYAPAVMVAWDAPWLRKLFFVAPSQSGKTTVFYACAFASLYRNPSPVALVMPDQEAVERAFEKKLVKHVEASPALRGRLGSSRYALQKTEIRFRDGGFMQGLWAGSESRISSESYEMLLVDEEDAYSDRIIVGTAEERVTAYTHTHKIARFSKIRGGENEGTIDRDMRAQAQVLLHFEAVCPSCLTRQRMEFERIRVPEGERDPGRILGEKLAWYECANEGCRWKWSDHVRNKALALALEKSRQAYPDPWKALARGEPFLGWVPDRPVDRPTCVGFRLRSWELPFVSLSKVMADWFGAQGDPRKMQLWDNNHAAKPYKAVVQETNEDRIKRLVSPDVEQLTAPAWTVALTLSTDMQMRDLRYSVAAHGVNPDRLAIIDYGTAPDFEALRRLVFESSYRLQGTDTDLHIWRAAVDTGGTTHEGDDESRTMQCYNWLLDQRHDVITGTKGMSRKTPGVYIKPSLIEATSSGKKLKHGLRLHHVDVDAFKAIWFDRLEQSVKRIEGALTQPFEDVVEFHVETDTAYLREVTAEKLVAGKNGKQEWKRFRANHWLDCAVLHLAMVHFQWAPSLRALASHILAARNPAPKVERKKEAVNPYTGGVNVFGGGR
ncbi:terminase gpA endonuclease subunit [Desulfocurvibacter africanus]|uniref:Terminase GpA n=1 Tax=Desulfocurvibacter africanus subsp. africanus str. Walvis Bay TaxID=690850 RepID=F3Z2S1_DESAF|nr:terminase gpA endonuclease subunit [Desulfocurvibacter africanus]EGJ50238.1 hypothetical protein Desaf_1909 [Desulfocurvibacter africanus subsp. africanus str. Walvis Bay]